MSLYNVNTDFCVLKCLVVCIQRKMSMPSIPMSREASPSDTMSCGDESVSSSHYAPYMGEYRSPYPFRRAIDQRQWQTAIEFINQDPYTFEKGPIDDLEYRQALINFASPTLLLNVSINNINTYPELLEVFLKTRDMNVQDNNLELTLRDFIYESTDLTAGSGGGGVQYNIIVKLMLEHGMSPNRLINGKSLVLLAFSAHNYILMNEILNHPQFVMLPEYLDIVNQQMAPLDQMRETMLQRLRPTSTLSNGSNEPSKKRSRYCFEE